MSLPLGPFSRAAAPLGASLWLSRREQARRPVRGAAEAFAALAGAIGFLTLGDTCSAGISASTSCSSGSL